MSKAIDPALFRETLGHYPTGVAAVTAVAEDGKPAGMVVGTFSSVSLDPPLIAFFPAASSKSFAQLRMARAFCVNVLAADQEPLCRQLSISGAGKFDGVRWRPGPLGSPVLEGVVSWIECTFEQIGEAGDHYVVLGRVHELAVERSTLPLLFFQGGYGQFSPGSFIAAPDPDLIQAAQLAETIRPQVENLAAELAVSCSVLVKIGGDSVQVLAVNQGSVAEPLPLGHRQPVIPPFGANFLVNATPAEVEEWLRRAPDDSKHRRDLNRALLDKVRERGYSVLTADPELVQRHLAALSAFELSHLPRQERAVQQATSELADYFAPDLLPGHRYELASIVVPISTKADLPPMAIRLSGLPTQLRTEQIESWVNRLKRVAAIAAASMNGSLRCAGTAERSDRPELYEWSTIMAGYDDKTEILEILNLYGFALDAHQWQLFDRIFTEDVIAEFGPAGAAWKGLAEFKRSFAEFHDRLDSHQHTMMGQLVHVDGDKANAFSYGNWLLVREAAEGGSTWLGTGWYDDELIRTDEGWRIQHRVCRLQSWSGNPFVPEQHQEHNPDMHLNVLSQHAEEGKIAFLKAIETK